MSDTESFEQVMEIARHVLCDECGLLDNFGSLCLAHDNDCHDCEKSMVARLKAAHDREIRDTAQREYHRGYTDGRHSMNAEHAAVAMRLRGLPMNRVEYGSNLYDIIEAVCGTNKAGDVDLRDKLIDLMGGVSDGPADDSDGNADSGYRGRDIHFDGVTAYDVLGNERQKAIAELRELRTGYGRDDDSLWNWLEDLYAALGCNTPYLCSLGTIKQRIIYLLGGGQPSGIDVLREMDGDGTCPNDVPTSSITNELREWMDVVLTADDQAWAIADRIDERAKHDREYDQLRIEKLVRQRDELKRAAERDAGLIESMARDLNDTEIERDELQAKLDKANGENKGLRLSVDEQKESIAQRKKTMKKLARDNEKLEKQRDELQAKLDKLIGHSRTCPKSGNEVSESAPSVSITDELREWASTEVPYKYGRQLHAIAGRIDEQFARVCQQQEDVLQSTIERMADENLTAKDERDHWKREASELRAKLDAIWGVFDVKP